MAELLSSMHIRSGQQCRERSRVAEIYEARAEVTYGCKAGVQSADARRNDSLFLLRAGGARITRGADRAAFRHGGKRVPEVKGAVPSQT